MSKILFFTGAGISAESGISTFRNNEDGLWTKYKPDVVANLNTFEKNKEVVFKFYNERRVALKDVQPNKAHIEIAKLQQELGPENVKIVTQNIDNLFEKAGCVDVLHVHGELTKMKCLSCSNKWDIGYAQIDIGDVCPECGSVNIKPAVIFFNEPAPNYQEMFDIFSNAIENDIKIVIGTSGSVISMRFIVDDRKCFSMICNKDRDGWIEYSMFNLCFFEPATVAIDKIIKIAKDKINE
jgi:NAD-dependent deacetylase